MIIGHRGAADLAPENSLEALRAGLAAGADMLEFDIRLTKDGVAVVIHDPSLLRTHRQKAFISKMTLAELKSATATQPVPTLREVLEEFYGKITLNIECKSNGSGVIAVECVKEYVKTDKDWRHILFSSFRASELKAIRALSSDAPLALLHGINPIRFMAYDSLHLSAAGFHKATITKHILMLAKRRRLMTYAYTVDRPSQARRLEIQGVDGVVTNRPDLLLV